MTAQELRECYLNYFESLDHNRIASASLIPRNDPSALFISAGMHPLVPFLLGETHPLGSRLTGVQKCLRTDDIDEVGDETHHTFFEMLGNWSLRDYGKQEAIAMSYRFLTDVLAIPGDKLAVSFFAGTSDIPRDQEAYDGWRACGLEPQQIFPGDLDANWWGPVSAVGPCGPDTEIFYDTGKPCCGENCGPFCDCGRYVEIWNNVFMQYNKRADGSLEPLPRLNIDTGMGLERILAVLNGWEDNYRSELFWPLLQLLEEQSGRKLSDETIRDYRIVADHVRSVAFILGDQQQVEPSNSEQGYVVRRLLRRLLRILRKLESSEGALLLLLDRVVQLYGPLYPELLENRQRILELSRTEAEQFYKALDRGLSVAHRWLAKFGSGDILPGEIVFRLFDTFGFPLELTRELALEHGLAIDQECFLRLFREHQLKSRSAALTHFKGGLADDGPMTQRLHTATHLLHAALRHVLGSGVEQRGSNITAERLRFDFSFPRKLTADELEEVSRIVNEAIQQQIEIVCEEMSIAEARQRGALGLFADRYEEVVKVYRIGVLSQEICGGPHAANTAELGHFRILKEESASAGVRRIRAIIEPPEGDGRNER